MCQKWNVPSKCGDSKSYNASNTCTDTRANVRMCAEHIPSSRVRPVPSVSLWKILQHVQRRQLQHVQTWHVRHTVVNKLHSVHGRSVQCHRRLRVYGLSGRPIRASGSWRTQQLLLVPIGQASAINGLGQLFNVRGCHLDVRANGADGVRCDSNPVTNSSASS